ncbi:hypothetical protein DFP72DRAFT_928782 [Ephemerocybe angulata]|uniref:Uncharacterized protein n=1 Tax=Ephemerocybe angulata TaxID=980116 RepID=A0A8H6HCE2_9AGAR|nr:hypothetical protein DFP72DRAFT_928782 [Tulosesus angulatus]
MPQPLLTIDSNSQDQLHSFHSSKKLVVTLRPQRAAMDPVLVSNGPQFDPKCLSCPLETLAQTLKPTSDHWITSTDLVETYTTLSIRLRTSANALLQSNQDSAHVSASTLASCLQRDINEGSKIFPRPCASKPTLEDYEIQSAADASFLSQSALRVAATVLSLPALYSLFNEPERSNLIDAVVEICSEPSLAVMDSGKVHALAFLCLRADAILAWATTTHVSGITEAVGSALDGDHDIQVQALKTCSHFLTNAPERFLRPMAAFLPKVLVLLAKASTEAALALGAFAAAKLKTQDLATGISNEVLDFMDHHGSRSKSKDKEHLFPAILQTASQRDKPVWALISIAALVVLEGASIFSHPRSVRLICDALRYTSRHSVKAISNMHTEVWKCLVWALSRIFIVESADSIDARRDTFGRAVRILVQELKPSVGASLISVLLDTPAGIDERFMLGNVSEAVQIVKQLVSTDKQFEEGYALLRRLVGGIGSSDYQVTEAGFSSFVHPSLLDGTWFRMPASELSSALSTPTAFDLSHVRSLTESEINSRWPDLSEVWVLAVEKLQPKLTAELVEQLTGIWQALLLCQAHLTQGQNHLTASTPFATQLASLLTRLLTPTAPSEVLVTQLMLLQKCWRVLKNVFETSWLSIPAEIVLAGIIGQKIDLEDAAVREMWCGVCSELISAGAPTLLHILHTRVTSPLRVGDGSEKEVMEELLVTRLLWVGLGRHYIRGGDGMGWTDLAPFLALPFHQKAWGFDEEELELWETVCEATFFAAQKDGVDEHEVLQYVIAQVEEGLRDTLYAALFGVAVRSYRGSLCRSILTNLCEMLSRWYRIGNKEHALRLMRSLGQFWAIEEPSELLSSVEKLQVGVTVWLEDQNGLADEVEHANMVEAVYAAVLESLHRCANEELDLLSRLEPLLTSAFRTAHQSTGPRTMLDFWHAHYEGKPALTRTCPVGLLSCLKGFGDIAGQPVGDDNSLGTSSPSTIISDSQSSVNPKLRALQHEYSRFEDFQNQVGYGFQVGPSASFSQVVGQDLTPASTSSGGMMTPKPSPGPTSALKDLRAYHSMREDEEDVTPVSPVSPLVLGKSSDGSSIQRRRVPKRHYTADDLPSSILEDESLADEERPPPLKRTKTISGPVSFRSASTRLFPQETAPKSPLPQSSDHEDDFDSWETGISHKDIQDLRQEMGSGEGDGDSDMFLDEDEHGEEEGRRDANGVLSPTFSEFAYRSRRRERSQTAPELDPVASPLIDVEESLQPLRRHHSSGSSYGAQPHVQLDALQQAYAAVVESGGVSQMGVEELLQLKRLTSRIGETVDEQIYHQLEREGSEPAKGKRKWKEGTPNS